MHTYTDARYCNSLVLSPSCIIVYIDEVYSTVPIDPANTDYVNIMSLVASGALAIAPAV